MCSTINGTPSNSYEQSVTQTFFPFIFNFFKFSVYELSSGMDYFLFH